MIRKTLFEKVGSFNEHFFTAYQDVDLCLRLRARGLRVIYNPQALLAITNPFRAAATTT